MSAQNLTLAGPISARLAAEPSDADQLADLVSVLRILREAVRDEEAGRSLDGLIDDIAFFSAEHTESEQDA